MSYRILTDDDLPTLLPMPAAVAAVRRAFELKAAGHLVAPPRFRVGTDAGGLAFTAGAAAGDAPRLGFRVYDTFGSGDPGCRQIVAVFDGATGALRGLVIGDLLGAIRTGAIGGVAIDRMARADARVAGVVGAGGQARTQLAAAAAVRPLERARVFSRTPAGREAFAAEMADRLGLPVEPVATAREAVTDADLVLCATGSGAPVFEAAWLAPGCHVNTVGPKVKDRHELDPAVAGRAAWIATDSPAQLDASSRPFFLDGTPARDRITDLASVVTGATPGRTSDDDITLFCSVGLAGTEVLVADAAFAAAK